MLNTDQFNMRKPSPLQKSIIKALKRKPLSRRWIYWTLYPNLPRGVSRRHQDYRNRSRFLFGIIPKSVRVYQSKQASLTRALKTLIKIGRIWFDGKLYHATSFWSKRFLNSSVI